MHLILVLSVTPWLAVLCWWDCKERRLPNVLTLGALAVALVWRLGWGGLPLFIDGVLGALLGGAFLLLPFLLKGAGGGDVKMMLAAGAIAGNSKIVLLLLLVSLAGLAVAVVMLLLHKADGRRLWHYCHCVFDIRYDRAAGRAALPPADSERVRIPFGVAIALGLWGCLL